MFPFNLFDRRSFRRWSRSSLRTNHFKGSEMGPAVNPLLSPLHPSQIALSPFSTKSSLFRRRYLIRAPHFKPPFIPSCYHLLNWLDIAKRRKLSVLKLTFKSLSDANFPEYLRLSTHAVPVYNLWSSVAPLLSIPKESGTFMDSFANQYCPRIWLYFNDT